MKKIDLKCPRCGGIMQVSDDKTEANCSFCKNKFLIEKEKTLDEIKAQEEAVSYAREKGIRQAKEDVANQATKRSLKIFITIILVMAGFVAFAELTNYLSREYIKNPFECIDVSFKGENNHGEAIIKRNSNCNDKRGLNFDVEGENKYLKEGDKINVIAKGEKYRFGKRKKEYTVTGLASYLTNMEQLTKEILEKMHRLSYDKLKNEINADYDNDGKMVSLTYFKTIIHTDNDTKNAAYDIYKLVSKTKTGKTYNLLVMAKIEGVKIYQKNDDLFSYENIKLDGIYIDLGGDMLASGSLSIDKNYIGTTLGFKNMEEIKNYLNSSKNNKDGTMVIKE